MKSISGSSLFSRTTLKQSIMNTKRSSTTQSDSYSRLWSRNMVASDRKCLNVAKPLPSVASERSPVGGPFDFWWGGGVQIPKKISSIGILEGKTKTKQRRFDYQYRQYNSVWTSSRRDIQVGKENRRNGNGSVLKHTELVLTNHLKELLLTFVVVWRVDSCLCFI